MIVPIYWGWLDIELGQYFSFETRRGNTLEIRLDEKGLHKAKSGLSQVLAIAKKVVDGESLKASM